MLILATDSAGAGCGACVWRDGHILAHKREGMERGQDARLMPLIVETIKEAGIEFTNLDRIAVTRGPGSFTGVRIGLAAARGIGLASGKPVIGIDRFSIFHSLYAEAGRELLVVIESRRAELFVQFFPASSVGNEPQMLTPHQIEDFVRMHPGLVIVGDIATPDADILPACAQLASRADSNDPAMQPRPLYLRAPDVTLAKSR